MRFALIGCGRIATNHITAAQNSGLLLAAVCDVKLENMQALLLKHGLESDTSIARYENYKEMIEKEDIQLCAIATESGSHAEIALFCIDAGVNIIIEKPMAMCLAHADEIIRLSEEKGVTVAACHQNRFNLAVQEMRQALEKGRFGRLSHGTVHVRWNRSQDYYSKAPWRGTWAQDGGALMNQCIHGIDLLRWMMGDEIDCVYGLTRQQFHGYLEAEDLGCALVQFKNGAVGTIEGTTNVYPKNLEETLYLFGQNGTAKLGGQSCNTVDVWQFAGDASQDEAKKGFTEEVLNVYGNGHTSLYKDMVSAIKNGRKPYVDAAAGRRALELVLAIYKSQKTGLPVPLPLQNFSSIDMEGMFGG